MQAEEASDFIDTVSKMEGIYLEGVFSHFATADEADKSYAERQTNRWKSLLAKLEKRKVSIPLLHIANSAATIEFLNMTYDMVRIGISMYGLYPSNKAFILVQDRAYGKHARFDQFKDQKQFFVIGLRDNVELHQLRSLK